MSPLVNRVLPYAAAVGMAAGMGLFFLRPSFLPWLVGFVSIVYLVFYQFSRTLGGGMSSETAASRRLSIESSGQRLSYLRTDGKLGNVNFGGPLLGVSVYRGGIVVRPLFLRPCTILTSEIEDVRSERLWGRDCVTVRHKGIGCPSPILIRAGAQTEMARALETLSTVFSPSAEWTPGTPVPSLTDVRKPERRFWLAGGMSMTGANSLDAYPKGLAILMTLFSLVIAGVFIYLGVVEVIPKSGWFGLIWTGVAVAAVASGVRGLARTLRR